MNYHVCCKIRDTRFYHNLLQQSTIFTLKSPTYKQVCIAIININIDRNIKVTSFTNIQQETYNKYGKKTAATYP